MSGVAMHYKAKDTLAITLSSTEAEFQPHVKPKR
jgi:hypothetical protein